MGSLKIFSGTSNLELAKEVAEFVGIPLGIAPITCFPDGETFVKYDENIRGSDIFIIQSTSKPANHNIMELLIMIDAARRASADRITAVMPFYGYARQDRKDKPRVPITSKLVANLLVSAGADRILTMDLHAQQITGFFDIPVDHLYAAPVFYNYLQRFKSDKLTVASPDIGGMKMAAAYADMLGAPLCMVAKRRLTGEDVDALQVIGDIKDRDILLVDDMTETAGTIVAATEILKANGACSVRAAVTHGVLNERGFERLSKSNIDELITTNSTNVPRKSHTDLKITELSIAQLLGEAIIRIHESVTSLFKIKGF